MMYVCMSSLTFLQPRSVFEIQFLFECYIQGAKDAFSVNNEQRLPYSRADITRVSKFIRISSSLHPTVVTGSKKKLRHVLNQYEPTNRTNQSQS